MSITGKYLADEIRLEKNFTYYSPKEDQLKRYEEIREEAKNFARNIQYATPISRKQMVAMTKIEEAVFWANAAIARNE